VRFPKILSAAMPSQIHSRAESIVGVRNVSVVSVVKRQCPPRLTIRSADLWQTPGAHKFKGGEMPVLEGNKRREFGRG
jgi:hypothetical protein